MLSRPFHPCASVQSSRRGRQTLEEAGSTWLGGARADSRLMRRPTLSRIWITCALALGALATQQAPAAPLEPRGPALVPPTHEVPPALTDEGDPRDEVVPAVEPVQLDGAATHGGVDNGATGDAAPTTVPPLEPYPWPVLTTAPLEPDGGAEATEEAAEGGNTQEAGLAGAEAEEREPPQVAAGAPAEAAESAAGGAAAQPADVAAADPRASPEGAPGAAGAELPAGDLSSEAPSAPSHNESKGEAPAAAAAAEGAEGETSGGGREEAPPEDGGGGDAAAAAAAGDGGGEGGGDGGGEGGEAGGGGEEEGGEEGGGPEEPMIPSLEKWKEQALQRLQSDAMKAGLRGDAAEATAGEAAAVVAAAGLDAGLSEGGPEGRGPETFVRPNKPLKDRFNYLSSTAGAKVLAANAEMQNDRNILNEDKDKYMMT